MKMQQILIIDNDSDRLNQLAYNVKRYKNTIEVFSFIQDKGNFVKKNFDLNDWLKAEIHELAHLKLILRHGRDFFDYNLFSHQDAIRICYGAYPGVDPHKQKDEFCINRAVTSFEPLSVEELEELFKFIDQRNNLPRIFYPDSFDEDTESNIESFHNT